MGKLCAVITLLGLCGCLVVTTTYNRLPPGPYRAVLYLDGKQSQRLQPDSVAAHFNLDDVVRGELPFNFEISLTADSSLLLTLINGEERIPVPDISYERLLESARDSITIRFPLNDSYFTGYHEDGVFEGYFVDETRDEGLYRIPMVAQFGLDHRFTEMKKPPVVDLSGTWSTTFGIEDGATPYAAIAEFRQEGNALSGTFQTATGDFRYLSGTVQGERAYLSTFDGAHAFLFSAKLQSDGTLLGIFRSGKHYQTIWEARRDPNARLPDPEQETRVVDSLQPVVLAGLLPSGRAMTITDSEAEFKVVSLFGSWCPNCRDEALFLDSLRQTVDPSRVAFYGAAFERMRDTSRALAALTRFGESLQLNYPLVLVATTDSKAAATAQLGFLDKVRSYPTLLILDENNHVVYTHTGFAGPATGAYGEFTQAFAKTLQNLLDQ